MELKSKLYKIIPYTLCLIHLVLSIVLSSGYDVVKTPEQRLIFLLSKIFSFICIIFIWNIPIILYNAFRDNNTKIKEISKYTLIYFIINLIVFVLIFPTAEGFYDISRGYNFITNYQFDICLNIVTNVSTMLFYGIIPSFSGMIICNLFIFSLIFGYVIYGAKYYISEKYYKLIFIPFFFPVFLVFNQIYRRNIQAVWLALFLFVYILYNKDREQENNYMPIILGIISACFINLGGEFLPFAFVLPFMVLIFKVFPLQKYIVYLLIFITFFSSFSFIKESYMKGVFYKREQYIFVYQNLDNEELLTDDYKIFCGNIYSSSSELTNKDTNIVKNCNQQTEKLIIKHSAVLLKNNYKMYNKRLHIYDFMNLQFSKSIEYFSLSSNELIPNELYNHPKKEKITSLLLYSTQDYKNNNFSKLFYRLDFSLLIMSIILLLSLFKKRYVYSIFSVTWFSVLFLVMIIAMYAPFIYFYPFFFISYILFFLFVLDLISGKISN